VLLASLACTVPFVLAGTTSSAPLSLDGIVGLKRPRSGDVPEEDPDVYTRGRVDAPKRGVFKNIYTPGSIVKLWHEEAMRAEEAVEEGEEHGGGWRNEIFDVSVM